MNTLRKCWVERLMDEVVEALGANTAPHTFGRREMNKNAIPPRVSWILAGSTFEAGSSGGNPRTLWFQHQNIEIHVWGRDSLETRELWSNELVALRRLLSDSSMRPQNITPEKASEQWLSHGDVSVVTVTVKTPVTDRIDVTQSVGGFTQEFSGARDNGSGEAVGSDGGAGSTGGAQAGTGGGSGNDSDSGITWHVNNGGYWDQGWIAP